MPTTNHPANTTTKETKMTTAISHPWDANPTGAAALPQGNATVYATTAELIEREIMPALDGVGPNFPIDTLVERLREMHAIRYNNGWVDDHGDCTCGAGSYMASRTGYYLVADDEGITPGFWELVEELDADA